MFTNRQVQIINIMLESISPLSLSYISNVIGKSERTIQRDLADIAFLLNKIQVGQLIHEKKGYSIQSDDSNQLLALLSESISDEGQVLFELILHQSCTTDDLCDALYLSRQNVAALVNSLKKKFPHFKITSSRTGIRIHLSEVERILVLRNFFDKNLYYYLDRLHVGRSTYLAILEFVEHHDEVAAMFPRLLPDKIAVLFVILLHLYGNCTSKLEKNAFWNAFQDVTGIIATKKMNDILEELIYRNHKINEILTPDSIHFILKKIGRKYNYDFQKEDLTDMLISHLKFHFMYPCYLDQSISRNIKELKLMYPIAFDMALSFSNLVYQLYGYPVDNIDYLGLYFSVDIERYEEKEKTILIYSYQNSIAILNKELLTSNISNISILITSDELLLMEHPSKIIINMVNNKKYEDKITYNLKGILKNDDIQTIKEKNEIFQFQCQWKDIFLKQYSFCLENKETDTSQDVLFMICNKLKEINAVGIEEFEAITEREKKGSNLVIENIWIPHCISRKYLKNACIFVHLRSPISIEGKIIDNVLVTLISVANMNHNVFKFLLKYISTFAEDIKGSKSYDDFTRYIENL